MACVKDYWIIQSHDRHNQHGSDDGAGRDRDNHMDRNHNGSWMADAFLRQPERQAGYCKLHGVIANEANTNAAIVREPSAARASLDR